MSKTSAVAAVPLRGGGSGSGSGAGCVGAAARCFPLLGLGREEADPRLLVLLGRIQRALLLESYVAGEIIDDRLALVDGPPVDDRVEVVRPVIVNGPEVAVRDGAVLRHFHAEFVCLFRRHDPHTHGAGGEPRLPLLNQSTEATHGAALQQ